MNLFDYIEKENIRRKLIEQEVRSELATERMLRILRKVNK